MGRAAGGRAYQEIRHHSYDPTRPRPVARKKRSRGSNVAIERSLANGQNSRLCPNVAQSSDKLRGVSFMNPITSFLVFVLAVGGGHTRRARTRSTAAYLPTSSRQRGAARRTDYLSDCTPGAPSPKCVRSFAMTWRSVILSSVCTATTRAPSFMYRSRLCSSTLASPGPKMRRLP
jgi:hypothetical protein